MFGFYDISHDEAESKSSSKTVRDYEVEIVFGELFNGFGPFMDVRCFWIWKAGNMDFSMILITRFYPRKKIYFFVSHEAVNSENFFHSYSDERISCKGWLFTNISTAVLPVNCLAVYRI